MKNLLVLGGILGVLVVTWVGVCAYLSIRHPGYRLPICVTEGGIADDTGNLRGPLVRGQVEAIHGHAPRASASRATSTGRSWTTRGRVRRPRPAAVVESDDRQNVPPSRAEGPHFSGGAQIPILRDLNGYQKERAVANVGLTWLLSR
ncbi:MAG TPA: hypothetical protein VLL75_13425 [Vicinamibacteria bacterium]|nr:hypothetical protein [Vicinamibacteria bacterium]